MRTENGKFFVVTTASLCYASYKHSDAITQFKTWEHEGSNPFMFECEFNEIRVIKEVIG